MIVEEHEDERGTVRGDDIAQGLAQFQTTPRFLTNALGSVVPELWDLRLAARRQRGLG